MGLKLKSKGGASIAARDSEKARALKQSHDCQSFENLSPYSGLSYQHFCPLLYYEYSIVLKAIYSKNNSIDPWHEIDRRLVVRRMPNKYRGVRWRNTEGYKKISRKPAPLFTV